MEVSFDTTQFGVILLIISSLGLLIVNFFRFNILFALAGIMVNIWLMTQPDLPRGIFYMALLIAIGEAFALVARIFLGKKNSKKRFVG